MKEEIALTVKDHACSEEEFRLMKEPGSTLLRTDPVPRQLEKYYQEGYISHEDDPTTTMGHIYQFVKGFMLKRKLRWIRSWCKSGSSLLDVGAGTGGFLQAAQRKGWMVQGTEPNVSAREAAIRKGLDMASSPDELGREEYDVITLWHVLEHVQQPDELIRRLSLRLKRNGVLVIALPNHASLDAKIYQSLWAAYDVPRHLWHFDPQAITHLMSKLGYERIAQKPLFFDAFYVCMISEKFRSGKGNLIRAFYNAVRSNLSALFTGEYSSLTYAFKRA